MTDERATKKLRGWVVDDAGKRRSDIAYADAESDFAQLMPPASSWLWWIEDNPYFEPGHEPAPTKARLQRLN